MANKVFFRALPRTICGAVLAALTLFAAMPAQAGLGLEFSKSFTPDTIGPGSVSTLVFTIDNTASGSGVTNMSFTDTLPAGVTIATPANVLNDCGGTVTAPDGGGTITFADGLVAPSVFCTVRVNVTSSTPGLHTNLSGDLTSSAGNSGTATDDLTVATDRPGFSKSFAPTTVGLGGRSTLTFTIDNSANASGAANLTFSDTLPMGIAVADPANTFTSCTGGLVTASPGGSVIFLSSLLFGGATVATGASCTVTVDVTGTAAGAHDNVSGELTSTLPPFGTMARSSGRASANLTVTTGALPFTKVFTDDPALPGSTVTLELSITNTDRDFSATNIAFTDDLDATLSGLVAIGLPASNVCGAGSTLSGTSLLSLSGGNLPSGGSCTFSVTLQVPAAAAAGGYPNTTSSITADVDGSPVVSAPASETLFVNEAPTLTKTFLTNPIGAGDTTTVEFTITNNSTTSTATAFSFQDNVSQFFSGATVTAFPANGFCGAGSMLLTQIVSGELVLTMTGGTLPASGSCTFTVDFVIPAGNLDGSFPNTTSPISATVDGMTQIGAPASDTLVVVAAPSLSKSFTDDPAVPGGTVTLEFTITQDALAAADATGITFTDDLNATLTGLAATGLPMNDVCGAGSVLSGTTTLSLTGGTLVPGASCTFSVTLQVPAAALPGNYPNNTSSVMATVSGVTVTGNPAADDLQIAGLEIAKSFTDDPVIAGDLVTLEFTITNTSATEDATAMVFTDNLSAGLAGLAAEAPLPATPCGAGSSIAGTTLLIFTGGDLTAGTSCTFSVNVRVPAGAADGVYGNLTSNLIASIGGSTAVLPPAADTLTVTSSILALSKTFTDDPVAPGGSVTLEFTLTNLSAADTATDITFTDDLDAALSGLVAAGLPVMNICGAGSSLTGSSLVTLSAGSLAAGASCTFSVTLTVPAGAGGVVATNTTSTVTGMAGGLPVDGAAASDDLTVQTVVFSKAFDGPTVAGGTPTLTFTIENLSSTSIANLSFSDDLDGVLTGLVATGLPLADVCGVGSQIAGTSSLTFTGGALLPNGSCSIVVSLQVPAGAAGGAYPNTTSDLLQAGLSVADPAADSLTVAPPPTFAKVFAPDTIVQGGISTLTLTIDNTASSLAASALSFADGLPTGVFVAATPNVSTTCTGGTLTAVAGTGVVAYSDGTAAAAASCTVSVDVTGIVAGAQVNTTSDLTSSSGNSGMATDTLTVTPAPPPAFTKVFAPDTIAQGGASTLTLTIDNTASLIAATSLAFVDNLPAGVVVATPSNLSTTCTGGTLTGASGSGSVTYSGGTVAATSSCMVFVDVVATVAGAQVNTTGDLTSSQGNSGMATDTLTVTPAPVPTFAKVFAPDAIGEGQGSTLTFTIDNTAALVPATGLDFTDNLPAGVEVAAAPNASTTCTGGTLSAAAGAGVISYTGGTVAAASSCTVTVDVVGTAPGSLVNTTGDLTSSLGNSGRATDTLVVNPVPGFAKVFAPNPIAINGVSTLGFTIDNTGSTVATSALAFTDNLPAAVVVATPANAVTTCTGGTLTAAPGSGTISYTGGTVAAASSCTVNVDVTSAAVGAHVNVTGDLTSSLGNSGTATDTLTVNPPPGFAKVFAPDLINTGGITTLTFTIDNTASTAAAASLAFTDNLPALVVVATPANAVNTCTGGTLTAAPGSGTITYTGGTVAAASSCTISVDVTSSAAGTHVNLTGDLTSSLANSGTATDTLTAEAVQLTMTKAFVVNPVLPGGSVDLEYTITNSSANLTVSGIGFTDDMGAVLPGLVATAFSPLAGGDPCGAGSTFSGASLLTLAGGNLAPSGSCTFRATLQLPAAAVSGIYPSTSSAVAGTATGGAVAGTPASANLEVTALIIEKFFASLSAPAGSLVDLIFTLTNPDPVNIVTDLSFSDDLDAALAGMEAIGLPQLDVCGVGSQVDGTSVILLTGGTLAGGGSCTFTVSVRVPVDASSGSITNVTSGVDATVGGLSIVGDPAAAATADVIVVAVAVSIPTLSTWGLLLLLMLLSLVAVRRLRSQ